MPGFNTYQGFIRVFWQEYDYLLRDKEQRRGQARMNALRRIDPELYELVAQSPADCFYRDELIPEFDNTVFGPVFGKTYSGR